MGHPRVFYQYTAICDVEGCDHHATYKVAAPWTDGHLEELRNYGVYCTRHAEAQFERARQRQACLKLCPGEQVGEIRLYEFVEGRLDAELIPIA